MGKVKRALPVLRCVSGLLLQPNPRSSAAARDLHAPSANGEGRARSVVAVSAVDVADLPATTW